MSARGREISKLRHKIVENERKGERERERERERAKERKYSVNILKGELNTNKLEVLLDMVGDCYFCCFPSGFAYQTS